LKSLILLTSEFPFEKGETFLENEFPFLESAFSWITILTEANSGASRIESEETETCSFNKPGIFERTSALFHTLFWKEIGYLLKNKKLTTYTLRTAWYSLSKALALKKTILQFNKKLNFEETTFYSYWLDEKALALALLKKKYPKLKCISRAHGWDVYYERHKEKYLPYRKIILEILNQTLTISENGRDYLLNHFPHLAKKIKVSRLGTLALSSIPLQKEDNSLYVLSISSIIPLKRVNKILEIVSSVTNRKIHWTHIGGGPLLKELKTLALQREKQNPNFSYSLLGQKTNRQVRQFLSENYIDLFVNLSETEGIPVSIMEAQSAGITVLATAVGGVPEIVNDKNGFLTEKELSTINFAEIISDDTLLFKKREESFENWKSNFNADKNYNDFITEIKNLN
jgi:glycosyltransferase involved in cell wall biosynthesis